MIKNAVKQNYAYITISFYSFAIVGSVYATSSPMAVSRLSLLHEWHQGAGDPIGVALLAAGSRLNSILPPQPVDQPLEQPVGDKAQKA